MTVADDCPAPLLRERDVARWLNVSAGSLESWRSAGVGPPWLRIVGSVRYDRAAVAEWLQSGEGRAATAAD